MWRLSGASLGHLTSPAESRVQQRAVDPGHFPAPAAAPLVPCTTPASCLCGFPRRQGHSAPPPGHHVQPLPEASVQQGQDIPAQAQVRAGHAALRTAQEGTGVAERGAGPQAGRAAAPRRGPPRLGGRARGGLLQPRQPHLRHHQRRLHGAVVPHHVGGPQVRVPLAGRAALPPAHGAVRAPLHGPAHGLDRGADQQRGHLPHQRRHAIPQELPGGGEEAPVAAVPRVRARVHPPLRPHRADGLRGARQHLLQALLLLRPRVRPHRHQGVGAAERNDSKNVPLRAAARGSAWHECLWIGIARVVLVPLHGPGPRVQRHR